MQDIYAFMISYGAVIIIAFALMQFLTNGFLWTFLKIKGSRGKKVLVEVRGKMQNYYTTGVIQEGWLIFRDNVAKAAGRKAQKRLAVPTYAVYRKLNVNCINVDEERNCVLMPDLRGVSGYDAIKWEGYLVRALTAPKLQDNSILLIVILIAVLLVGFGVIFIAVKMGNLQASVNGLYTTLHNASTIVGGNVPL